MRFTFIVGAVLATVGTALAVYGVQQTEGKLFGEGFVLLRQLDEISKQQQQQGGGGNGFGNNNPS